MFDRPLAALVTLALLGAPSIAGANSRFPAAQYVIVGPGASSTLIALRTTFGILASNDGGATFHWICEMALQNGGTWDPPIAFGSDGSLSAGLTSGLIQTPDFCTFALNASAGAFEISDLTTDPTDTTMLAVQAGTAVANHVLASTDHGTTFAMLGTGIVGFDFATIELAASNPMRVYATGIDETTRMASLMRSDDGGATLANVTGNFNGGVDAYVSAVDPTDADRIWLRSNLPTSGTLLLRSDDAGQTYSTVTQTTGLMSGFAMSDDAQRIWIGGPDDGLLLATAGGPFMPVASLHVNCLRWHAGALYVCTDDLRDGFALARWDDGAPTYVPLIDFVSVQGAFDCPAGTVEADSCGPAWPTQLTMLRTRIRRDAGVVVDAAADAADAAIEDVANDLGVDAAPDAGTTSGRGCGCRAAPRNEGGSVWMLLGLAMLGRRRGRIEEARLEHPRA